MLVRRPVAPTLATLAITVLGQLTISTQSAHAATTVDPVLPQMSVTIDYPTSDTQKVCWSGRLRGTSPTASPTWRVVTIGQRSDGTAILDGPWFYPASSVSDCFTVDKRGLLGQVTDVGYYVTTFSYDGDGQDIPSVLQGVGLWATGQNNKVERYQ